MKNNVLIVDDIPENIDVLGGILADEYDVSAAINGRQALYDSLTNIPNRILLMERMNRAIERLKRYPECVFAVLMIDLDRFKEVNDSMGHIAGDKVLLAISKRILASLRSVDTLARIGGDEFVVLLESVDSVDKIERIAGRIQEDVRKPFIFNNVKIMVSASIGVVFNTDSHRSSEALLRDADIAMYCAKDSGKACFRHYEQNMHKQVMEKIKIENDLRLALEKKQLKLFYQPIFSIADNELCGFEALLRWAHPDYGMIAPLKFIPVAEETGLIIPIGTWIIDTACRRLAVWHEKDPVNQHLGMNINVSVRQFLEPDFIDFLKTTLKKHRVEPGCLRIEITESLLMQYSQQAVEKMNAVRQLGIRIAIDDFGTGYSSLAYVQRFPIDQLKLDRSFIHKIAFKQKNVEVVKAIIAMSKSLGFEVVAEGIENQQQLDILKELHCDSGQGFLLSRPMTEEQADCYIKNHYLPQAG